MGRGAWLLGSTQRFYWLWKNRNQKANWVLAQLVGFSLRFLCSGLGYVRCVCSVIWLFVTLSTVTCQTPLSMGFSRLEYWSELLYPPPGYLPNPGIEPVSLASPTLADRVFTIVPPGKPTDATTYSYSVPRPDLTACITNKTDPCISSCLSPFWVPSLGSPSSLSVQFSSVSHVRLFVTPWITARQASLSITNSQSSLRLTSIESVMPSSHLILCRLLLLLSSIPPSIRVFSNESTLRMRWPKYWSFSCSIIPSKEIPGLISFRMDWLDLLAVQGTL